MFFSNPIIKCLLLTTTLITLTFLISHLETNPINSKTLTFKSSHKRNPPNQTFTLTQEVTSNYLNSPRFPSLPNLTSNKFKPLALPNTFIPIFPTINSTKLKLKNINNPIKLPSKALNLSKLKENRKKISTIQLHKKYLEGTIFPMVQFTKASSIPIINLKVFLDIF
jgi:hypothetical protein